MSWIYLQTYSSASGIISKHTCQCLELFPDIYVSIWNYFHTYVVVSGNISFMNRNIYRHLSVSGNISRQIWQCLELFPDIYVSVWKYFQTNMSGNWGESTRILLRELSGNSGFVREMSENILGGFCWEPWSERTVFTDMGVTFFLISFFLIIPWGAVIRFSLKFSSIQKKSHG